jgi:hypothetical protein
MEHVSDLTGPRCGRSTEKFLDWAGMISEFEIFWMQDLIEVGICAGRYRAGFARRIESRMEQEVAVLTNLELRRFVPHSVLTRREADKNFLLLAVSFVHLVDINDRLSPIGVMFASGRGRFGIAN